MEKSPEYVPRSSRRVCTQADSPTFWGGGRCLCPLQKMVVGRGAQALTHYLGASVRDSRGRDPQTRVRGPMGRVLRARVRVSMGRVLGDRAGKPMGRILGGQVRVPMGRAPYPRANVYMGRTPPGLGFL